MQGPFFRAAAALALALVTSPALAKRNPVQPCPGACSHSSSPFDWMAYHAPERLSECSEPMLLDFSLYNDLNRTDSQWTLLACTPHGEVGIDRAERRRATDAIHYQETSVPLDLITWGASATSRGPASESVTVLIQAMLVWLGQSAEEGQFHIFGQYGDSTAGLYIGPSFERTSAAQSIVEALSTQIEGTTSPLVALQFCGAKPEETIGVVVSTTGDLSSMQRLVRQWRDGDCPSDYESRVDVPDVTLSKAPTTVAVASWLRRRSGPQGWKRAAACETTQVKSGDSCGALAERCGITGAEFEEYNDDPDLCSTLVAGQHVCCSVGDLPDFSPDPYENGTCYTHRVQTGESCATLAAEYSIGQDDVETWNEETWGWQGCEKLQANMNICLSSGDPPFPAPVEGAVCGPQVPGTEVPEDGSPATWASLNGCPLNACCNLWGWCGINPEFCEYDSSGNPGTGVCQDNCGTSIVNDDVAPDEFMQVGYFLASNLNRDCLTMSAYSIRTEEYTHIQFAFGNIHDDFSVGLMEGDDHQFEYFKNMRTVKRIMSFGGWDFSTFPDTYHIFRNGVQSENRATFAQNVVDFIMEHDLDGVDFDWEYPGAPDIPGIPPGEEEEGERYLAFLKEVRERLPNGKSLSICAPASFWYLQAFPIDEIADVVDYIVYMTYDLRGQWDFNSNDPPLGCPDGNCLRSHINATETQYALSMITKALVQTRKLTVGVSSYGRAFEMSEPGCIGPTCTYTGNGATPGRCTTTSGYLANAEISEILAQNGGAEHIYDEDSDSDILVYNKTQWVAYMTKETRDRRIGEYEGLNMGGSVEWSIDLQSFTAGLVPPGGIFIPVPDEVDIEEFCSTPDWDDTTQAQASTLRNVSAYLDYFFDEVRNGNTEDWVQALFGDTQTVTCSLYPEGSCDFPTPSDCEEMENDAPSLYWARFVVANYFQHMVQYGSMFEASTLNATLGLSSLVKDFEIKTHDASELANILKIFGGAMGVAGSAVGAVPGFPGGEAAESVLAGVGGMFSFISENMKEAEEPDTGEMQAFLDGQLQNLWSAGYKAGGDTLVAVFETGDLSKFPDSLKEGDWKYEISNFFDGRFMAKMGGSEANDIRDSLGENMMKSMTASAILFANYYIVKGGFSTDKCGDQTSGQVIDGTCYTLEYPGTGAPVGPRERFSRIIDKETFEKLTGHYQVDIKELYQLSEACQKERDAYGETMDLDTLEIFESDDKPLCFYNLPVITVNLDEIVDRDSWTTPCWVVVTNYTSDDDATPKVGETFLPDNLAEFFEQDFCLPCVDGSPSCDAGWLRGMLLNQSP